MKLIAKLTAIAAFAALTITTFASPANWPPTAPSVKPRVTVTTPAPKCDTMVINGGGRNGMQVVPCKDYAGARSDDCHRACANK